MAAICGGIQRRQYFRFALEAGEPIGIRHHRVGQHLQSQLPFQVRRSPDTPVSCRPPSKAVTQYGPKRAWVSAMATTSHEALQLLVEVLDDDNVRRNGRGIRTRGLDHQKRSPSGETSLYDQLGLPLPVRSSPAQAI